MSVDTEHSSKCFYANESKADVAMSACSVISSTSVCSSWIGNSRQPLTLSNKDLKPGKSFSSCFSFKKPDQLSYKESRKYCCRRSESTLLAQKHPSKIPLIIERFKSEKILKPLKQCQFMLPAHATVGQLQHVIRRRVCTGNMSIYVLVGSEKLSLPRLDVTIAELAFTHQDEDGFTYLKYSSEDALG